MEAESWRTLGRGCGERAAGDFEGLAPVPGDLRSEDLVHRGGIGRVDS